MEAIKDSHYLFQKIPMDKSLDLDTGTTTSSKIYNIELGISVLWLA